MLLGPEILACGGFFSNRKSSTALIPLALEGVALQVDGILNISIIGHTIQKNYR